MDSYFETDANCPACFNHLLDALSSTDGVEHVEGHIDDGCVSVTHRLPEEVLERLIASVGRTIEVADNAEYVMDGTHVTPRPTCGHHR